MAEITENPNREKLITNGTAGAIGGLIGGIAFGLLMGMMGMLPMIASLAGSSSATVGFILHMLISLFIGITFGLIFGPRSQTYQAGLGWGLLYGFIWWILGPMILMPAMMGGITIRGRLHRPHAHELNGPSNLRSIDRPWLCLV